MLKPCTGSSDNPLQTPLCLLIITIEFRDANEHMLVVLASGHRPRRLLLFYTCLGWFDCMSNYILPPTLMLPKANAHIWEQYIVYSASVRANLLHSSISYDV